MARNKAPQDIQRRREQGRRKRKLQASAPTRRWWKLPLETLGILSAVAGVLTLIPRLSLEISGSRQPTSPMQTVFSLANDSLLPVHDVIVTCHLDKWEAKNMEMQGIGFQFPESHAEVLSPSQRMSLPCDRIIEGRTTTTAKMTIKVTYRPDYVWWLRHIEFPAEAQHNADGTWLWRRLPR